MSETSKKSFPMLPVSHWFALRRKFKQSIPGVVTNSYLATVLNMGAESARANVLPFLKALGVIDDEGKPKERAKLWRDDEHYAAVCRAIIKEVYPEELLHAVPDPKANREQAKRWFANHTGTGSAAAGRMTALYTALVEADPSGDGENSKPKPPQHAAKEGKAKSVTQPRARVAEPGAHSSRGVKAEHGGPMRVPEININLQIHISADASPDQIEQIFAAMAKHIYER